MDELLYLNERKNLLSACGEEGESRGFIFMGNECRKRGTNTS